MGLYNLMFGHDDKAALVLAVLGLQVGDVGRFRDAGISDGKLYVYTRNGGGNREHYDRGDEAPEEGEGCDCTGCTMTYRIPKLPHYLSDEDDEFDSTYATVWFSFPAEYAEALTELDTGESWNPDERWTTLIDSIRATTGHGDQAVPPKTRAGGAGHTDTPALTEPDQEGGDKHRSRTASGSYAGRSAELEARDAQSHNPLPGSVSAGHTDTLSAKEDE